MLALYPIWHYIRWHYNRYALYNDKTPPWSPCINDPTCQDEHLLAEHHIVGDEVSRGEEWVLPALDLDHLSPLIVVVQDLGEAGVTDDAVVAVQGGPTGFYIEIRQFG